MYRATASMPRRRAARLYFALNAAGRAIGANTTIWLNTDLNAATGYQIFGSAGGAEYNLNIKADGTAALYTGADGQTLVLDNIQIAYSADHTFDRVRHPAGRDSAIRAIRRCAVRRQQQHSSVPPTIPPSPTWPPTIDVTRTPTHKVAIVYSDTRPPTTSGPRRCRGRAFDRLFRSVHGGAEPGPDGRRLV